METMADLDRLRVEVLGETPDATLDIRPGFDPIVALRSVAGLRRKTADSEASVATMPYRPNVPAYRPPDLGSRFVAPAVDDSYGDPRREAARQLVAAAVATQAMLDALEWRMAKPPYCYVRLHDWRPFRRRSRWQPLRRAVIRLWRAMGRPGASISLHFDPQLLGAAS